MLALLVGTDIRTRGHLDVNYAIGSIAAQETGGRFAQHLVSASASVSVSDRWNPYGEVFWISRSDPDEGAGTSINTGVIYTVGPRFAIDGGIQFGVSGSSDDFAAFGGFSVLVGQRRSRSPGASISRSLPSSRPIGNSRKPNP